jgi:hypothetical protein
MNRLGGIMPERLTRRPTAGMAWQHLTWARTPTSFMSVFSNIDRALNWAGTQVDPMQLDLVGIDLYNLPNGQLWNAHLMALAFGLNPYHHDQECLFHGVIEQDRILAVLPIGVGQIRILLHLGEICMPRALIEEANPTAEGRSR